MDKNDQFEQAKEFIDSRKKQVDRRKKRDWVVQSVTILAVLGWIGAVISLVLLDRATPVGENFFSHFLSLTVNSYWNSALLGSAFIAVLFSFVISIAGFIANMLRHRRKTDRYNKILITVGILSVVLLVVYLISFSGYLFG